MQDAHTKQRQASFRTTPKQIPESIKVAASLAVIFFAYGFVGHMDYQDAIAMDAANSAARQVQVAAVTPSTCN